MKFSVLFLALVTGCGFLPKKKDPVPPTPSQQEQLQSLLQQTTWAERWQGSATNDPSEAYSIGDALLFDSLLCYAGVEKSCQMAKASQDRDGRWWRAPYWINKEYGSGSVFSRDMALGAILFIQTTRDRDAAIAWEENLDANSNRLCPPPESNCAIRPSMWSVMNAVWRQIGESPYGPMEANAATWRSLGTEIAVTPTGFQLHLKAVSLLILRQAGKNVQGFANSLVERQPENAFFHYVAGNYDKAAEKTLAHCPREKPAGRYLWMWEREIPHPRPELKSAGWDCIFMSKLLLK